MKSILLKGDSFKDERGILRFVNETNPGFYRRFYLISHSDKAVIRAWQGHLMEEKAFYTVSGGFVIAVINPSCFESPDDNEIPELYQLTDNNNHLLRMPGGTYTGIKALSSNSTLLVLSNMQLEDSQKDDYRQPSHRWVDWDLI